MAPRPQAASLAVLHPFAVPAENCAAQRGVVLIVVLIVLGLLSLLAATSLHNASSTESISGNVRTTELATQAAEIALRHCESSAVENSNSDTLPPPTDWTQIANWDGKTPIVLDLAQVNPAGISPIYKRPPECMVEAQTVMNTTLPVTAADGTVSYPSIGIYLITARGFGPEVAEADAKRSRPVGTEVWLQSHIKVE